MAKSKNVAKKDSVESTVNGQSVLSSPQEDQKSRQTVEKLAVQNSVMSASDSDGTTPEDSRLIAGSQEQASSVKANTHSKNRKPTSGRGTAAFIKPQNKWVKIVGVSAGALALIALLVSGFSSQYFKGKTMPGVSVAGISSTAKNPTQLKNQLEVQKKNMSVSFKTEEKTLQPKLEEIGYQIDVDKTVTNAMNAKRRSGILTKVAFWRKSSVPAVIAVNDNLLSQYLETNTPNLSKAPQDAQLAFDANQAAFTITTQADGQGPNTYRLKNELINTGGSLSKSTIKVGIARKGPAITEAKLQPILQPANDLVSRKIVLSGLGFSYRAKPADIAAWVTPTPQPDGSIKLIIDSAKVQSYVESIGKKISSSPQDKKVIKDETTGAEVVIQEGRDGTELADRQNLANAIAQSLKNGQDTTQTMNITTAAYKTVNMNAYDKWIEVDLSEQRTTAYERTNPVKNFLIASGTRGHETPTGEFSIWLKVRSQTMKGGSKASGDYYDIPNVEWVSYFYQDYALHGAYWRKVFGYPASHGCVNMTNDDAHWVFDWAPVGTKVIVHA